MEYPAHFNFTRFNTPLEFITTIKETRVFVKRDDLTGMELSGNKVRKLDFLLKDAIAQGAKRVITCGGIQSNHCRATAFAATKLGLKSTLILKGKPSEKQITGNFFLNKILDVDFKFISHQEYQHIDTIMSNLAQSYREKCYIIPEGGSNALGAWGYVKAFEEIVQQLPEVDTIVCATGSGGTHSGLLIGKWLLNHPCKIISINVCDNAQFFKEKIGRIIKEFKETYAPHLRINENEILIVDGFVGTGYGQVTKVEILKIKEIAQKFGLVLDPVYTVKAWMGFEQLLQSGTLKNKKVVFVHTGGLFGLFAYSQYF